jgi:hypothetical protein
MEVTICLLKGAAADRAFGQLHTLWVEPLAANLVGENPYEKPGPKAPHLRPWPTHLSGSR